MLVHRTSSWMLDKPGRDARSMETTQTFQPRHGNSHSELLETNGALCIVDTILLRGYVRIHASPPGCNWCSTFPAAGCAIRAVRLDARSDVSLAKLFSVG
jgi:hypothetical protein